MGHFGGLFHSQEPPIAGVPPQIGMKARNTHSLALWPQQITGNLRSTTVFHLHMLNISAGQLSAQ